MYYYYSSFCRVEISRRECFHILLHTYTAASIGLILNTIEISSCSNGFISIFIIIFGCIFYELVLRVGTYNYQKRFVDLYGFLIFFFLLYAAALTAIIIFSRQLDSAIARLIITITVDRRAVTRLDIIIVIYDDDDGMVMCNLS